MVFLAAGLSMVGFVLDARALLSEACEPGAVDCDRDGTALGTALTNSGPDTSQRFGSIPGRCRSASMLVGRSCAMSSSSAFVKIHSGGIRISPRVDILRRSHHSAARSTSSLPSKKHLPFGHRPLTPPPWWSANRSPRRAVVRGFEVVEVGLPA